MSLWELLLQTCWWPLSDHWSVQLTSPHLSGIVWWGRRSESLMELSALWLRVTCGDVNYYYYIYINTTDTTTTNDASATTTATTSVNCELRAIYQLHVYVQRGRCFFFSIYVDEAEDHNTWFDNLQLTEGTVFHIVSLNQMARLRRCRRAIPYVFYFSSCYLIRMTLSV